MKNRLNGKELLVIASMLFGMFFGAGNLIFPASLGVAAGRNSLLAFAGLFITAVGLPLLAVAALGISRSGGVLELASHAGRKFGYFFPTLLYLTIGPFFAIPRCASTSFDIGAALLPENADRVWMLALFSLVFFAAVLLVSLRPGNIMNAIGKVLNPVFLILLSGLVVAALLNPVNSLLSAPAAEGKAFFKGFLEGYNTLDALAGLAFGIVVVNAVRNTGIHEPGGVAAGTVRAGIFSCLLMGVVYFLITLISVQSSAICGRCENGSEILGTIAQRYFGNAGTLLLFAIVMMACLKTAVGLVTSCSEAFRGMFPKGPGYRTWAVVFTAVAAAMANLGLSTIVQACVPVLMFLYPPAIVLILLALCGRAFDNDKCVWMCTVAFTVPAALLDLCRSLNGMLEGKGIPSAILESINCSVKRVLPFYDIGMGWVLPAFAGFIIGLMLYRIRKEKTIPKEEKA